MEALWDTLHGPLFAATVELWVAAKNNPELTAVLAPHEQELGRSIRTAIARMFGPALSARPGFPDLVAVLLTSMRGVALTYTIERRNHRLDPNRAVWKRLARVYLEDAEG